MYGFTAWDLFFIALIMYVFTALLFPKKYIARRKIGVMHELLVVHRWSLIRLTCSMVPICRSTNPKVIEDMLEQLKALGHSKP